MSVYTTYKVPAVLCYFCQRVLNGKTARKTYGAKGPIVICWNGALCQKRSKRQTKASSKNETA